MLDVGKSLVVVGCVCLGFVVSAGPGLVARAAEPDRWVENIAADVHASTASEESAQRRVLELERRVKELEAEHGSLSKSGVDLAAALARNESLESRNRALYFENQELAQSQSRAAAPASCGLPEGVDAKEQLRFWAKRMRESGRMSSEWNGAINVLLRRDRPLDPRNPWRDQ